jgi:beta-aspartyl-dipeptidase (metallo-type)
VSLVYVQGGALWSSKDLGVQSLLATGTKIAALGDINRHHLDQLRVPYDYLDAAGCIVLPGLIDVHEHLIGGSGEEGFASQTPEILLTELIRGGITTVVGCLGTDSITKTMPALLAKAKGLSEQGITAYVWSGGYDVPPSTLTGSVSRDMLYVTEVIGAGEIAIADHRSSAPSVRELAKLVKSVHVAGTLAGKAGVTHFHVGDEERRLADLRDLLDNYFIEPEWIYPTHVERNESLMREAVQLTTLGVTVDIDVVEQDLAKWVQFFVDENGVPEHLTASSDAAINSPETLLSQIRSCIQEAKLPKDLAFSLVTTNPARTLGLKTKGRLEVGCDADLLVLDSRSLAVRHVVARGKCLLRDGELVVRETFLSESNRRIELNGEKR